MANSTPSNITGLMGVTRNRFRIFRSLYPATTRGNLKFADEEVVA